MHKANEPIGDLGFKYRYITKCREIKKRYYRHKGRQKKKSNKK